MQTYLQSEVNLHTHSFYCGHGICDIIDYVHSAENDGRLKVLGFSEHCPVPNDDIPERMKMSQFPNYLNDIKNAAQETNLKILTGVECDWRNDLKPYYEDLKGKLDYLIGSVHFLKDHNTGKLRYIGHFEDFTDYLDEYTEKYIQMLESGLFLYGCHPDLFMGTLTWNEKTKKVSSLIIDTALKHDIPLEINGQGARKIVTDLGGNTRMAYPYPQFWKMVKEKGVRICCSSDAHDPKFVYEQKCFDFASKNGLEFINWNF